MERVWPPIGAPVCKGVGHTKSSCINKDTKLVWKAKIVDPSKTDMVILDEQIDGSIEEIEPVTEVATVNHENMIAEQQGAEVATVNHENMVVEQQAIEVAKLNDEDMMVKQQVAEGKKWNKNDTIIEQQVETSEVHKGISTKLIGTINPSSKDQWMNVGPKGRLSRAPPGNVGKPVGGDPKGTHL
ncbi:hypothetical protein ACFE04_021951 [Oxalis oulophora]